MTDLSYQQAFAKERRNGRLALGMWTLVTILGPFLVSGPWRIAWFVIIVIAILFIFEYWSQDAIRHRAFWNSDSSKS
jgi:hypothetical protein